MKKKRMFFNIVTLICLFLIVYSSYKIIVWKLEVDANKEIQNETKKVININEINNKESDKKEKYDIDFDSLKKMNNDVVGYIKVNNTNIDYVFVKGQNNNYYLNHNFEKKWNNAGWIFADYHNKFDGNDKNIVIYGHDMKDGSMFGTLKNILNKEWYNNADNYIIDLVTMSNEYEYQVFSTYSIDVEDYYINTIFNSNLEFSEFIRKLKSRSIYNYNVEVLENDKILTLSSCLGDGKKRVVLHAKLIKK